VPSTPIVSPPAVVLRSNADLSVLVNNAGIGSAAPLLGSDVDQMERMIGLNVTALTRLTYAAVPGFVARRRGTIVNHKEVASQGVTVQAVLPAATTTDFWEISGAPIQSLPEAGDWAAFEAARQTLLPNLSQLKPAARYRSSIESTRLG
jgi:uncharacterized protein